MLSTNLKDKKGFKFFNKIANRQKGLFFENFRFKIYKVNIQIYKTKK